MEAAARRRRLPSSAVFLYVVASCCHSASAVRVVISRRGVINAAGLTVATWPLSNLAVDDAECDDCKIQNSGNNMISGQDTEKRYTLGDVISLDDSSQRPKLFAERKKASAIPDPQFEAKRAMYRRAAGEYDVGATQNKIASLIESTPVLIFSLTS